MHIVGQIYGIISFVVICTLILGCFATIYRPKTESAKSGKMKMIFSIVLASLVFSAVATFHVIKG